jgi:hypothetical protein
VCDSCNEPEHRNCTGGAILVGCSSRNREASPVCSHKAGAYVAAGSVLLAEVPRPSVLAEFDFVELTDGNADRQPSARRSLGVRA